MSYQPKILIVEDELLISEMLKEMLKNLGYHVVAQAKTFDAAFDVLSEHPEINLAFLDINLNDTKTGVDVGKRLQDHYNIPFVFLTSYSDHDTIKNAVATQPESYLTKPFKQNEIFAAVETVRSKQENKEKHIVVKDGHLQVKLVSGEILFIQSENNYITIFTTGKKFTIRQSLEGFLEDLNDAKMIRIHRSYAVNLKHVTAVNGQYVVAGNEKIPLSRKYRDDVLALFSK